MKPLPELIHGQLALILLDRPARALVPALIARLALHTHLRVLDAGNCFAAYPIAREIRRATPDLNAALRRIQVARAFTCYQLLALLKDTPAGTSPVLVLDLLSTFTDENIRLLERQRLLVRCMQELQRISQQAPAAVILSPQFKQPDLPALLKIVEHASDLVWRFESQPTLPPARLF